MRAQGNYGIDGALAPPSSPTALQVTAASGLFTATVAHHSAPAGTRYVLQYASTPNFLSPISEELGSTSGIATTWQKSLPSGTGLYFRIASKFPASNLGPWVYVGNTAGPQLIQG